MTTSRTYLLDRSRHGYTQRDHWRSRRLLGVLFARPALHFPKAPHVLHWRQVVLYWLAVPLAGDDFAGNHLSSIEQTFEERKSVIAFRTDCERSLESTLRKGV